MKYVLFDLDGTLIKSIEAHYYAWTQILKSEKINIDRESFYINEGENPSVFLKRIFTENNKKITNNEIKKIIKKKNLKFKKIFKLRFYKNVTSTLNFIKQRKVGLGLVTTASKKRINSTIPLIFLNLFNLIVTREKIEFNKPSPEIYLKALKSLKIKSKDCLAVENSPNGIIAAKKARIKTIGITHTLSKKHLSKADIIIDNLKLIKKLI